MTRRSTSIWSITVFPLIALAACLITATPLSERLDQALLSFFFTARGSLSAPQNVAIIAMDEDSYRELGISLNQPFPRRLHARLLKRLKDYGVKGVVFDVLFAGASLDPSADTELAQGLASLPTVVGASTITAETVSGRKIEHILPYKPFSEAASSVARVELPETYGLVAHFGAHGGERSLAAAAATLMSETGEQPKHNDFISFYGPPGGIATYSYYQALDEEVLLPRHLLENKVIFVGLKMNSSLGAEQKDSYLTPASHRRYSGVEIHATAAANIIDHSWIRDFPNPFEFMVVAIFASLFGGLILLLPPVKGALVTLCSLLVWSIIGFLCYHQNYLLGGTLAVFITAVPVYLTNTLLSYLKVLKEQRKTKKAFECYLAPEMVRELVRNSEGTPDLGGELIEGVAFFTDIAGFTTLSETLNPRQVSEMLNAYFTDVMNVIFDSKGTLIKFIGDATFVIWGAPVQVENPCSLALEAALQIQKVVDLFNRRGTYPPLPTRIGVHAGPMLVGNLGAAKRFDYTAVGDTINLASRVEGLNKYFGTSILITGEVEKNLEGLQIPALLSMGKAQVKGKTEGVRLFAAFSEPLGEEASDLWSHGLRSFENRRWEEAQKLLDVAAQRAPQLQTAARFYCRQASRLSSAELSPDWAGKIDFDAK